MSRLPSFRPALVVALAGALAVSACASEPPSFGERLAAEGSEVSVLGERWTEGEAMINRGRALIEEGEKRIRRGERMVAEGKDMKRAAEEAYEARPSGQTTGG